MMNIKENIVGIGEMVCVCTQEGAMPTLSDTLKLGIEGLH